MEDKYDELMRWLEDQDAILGLPVNEGDFPAIREALHTAKVGCEGQE